MQTLVNFFTQFWRELTSFLGEVGAYVLTIFDPNSGPWPTVIVGGTVLLIVLIVISTTSRVR